MTEYIIIYAIGINILTFMVYGWDKSKARRGSWRISERKLIGLAVIGGSIGALAGMYLFHHKTKHIKFVIGVPLILVLHVTGVILFRKW